MITLMNEVVGESKEKIGKTKEMEEKEQVFVSVVLVQSQKANLIIHEDVKKMQAGKRAERKS